MNSFDIIWKFAIIGLLISIIVQVNQVEKTVRECLLVPEPELPNYEIEAK